MKKLFSQLVILTVLGLFLPVAKADRLPSAKKVQTTTQKFFKGYGKEFPNTIFGLNNLANVQINQIYEVSYKVAFADVILNFKNGRMGRAIMKLQNKFPKGWHVISWEIVGLQ